MQGIALLAIGQRQKKSLQAHNQGYTQKGKRRMGIYYQVVFHPKWPKKKLYLVILRPGKGRAPIYTLTNLKITTAKKAWRIVLEDDRLKPPFVTLNQSWRGESKALVLGK